MFSFMDCCSFCASECQHIALSHNSFMYFFLAKLSNKQQFFFLLFFSPEVHLHIFSTAIICLFAFRALLIFFFLLLNLLSFKSGLCRILRTERKEENSHHIQPPTSRKNVCVISSLNALYQAAFTIPGVVSVNNS